MDLAGWQVEFAKYLANNLKGKRRPGVCLASRGHTAEKGKPVMGGGLGGMSVRVGVAVGARRRRGIDYLGSKGRTVYSSGP